MVTVTARQPFSYQSRDLRPGDIVTMTPVDAVVLARQGKISLSRVVASPQVSLDNTIHVGPSVKSAEQLAEALVEALPEALRDARKAPMKKRQMRNAYKRRDMVAENITTTDMVSERAPQRDPEPVPAAMTDPPSEDDEPGEEERPPSPDREPDLE